MLLHTTAGTTPLVQIGRDTVAAVNDIETGLLAEWIAPAVNCGSIAVTLTAIDEPAAQKIIEFAIGGKFSIEMNGVEVIAMSEVPPVVVRCAFSTVNYARGCHWFPRPLA
jgi:hypothetical protein